MGLKAVIDLGTNTFHLLIAEKKNGKFTPVFKKLLPVKLGEGGINQGYIADAAYQRGLNALMEFDQDLKHFGVIDVKAFATSAIRCASNGEKFISEVANKTQLNIIKIDGDQEADLIFEGVSHAVSLTEEKVLVMDIGGGSVEFIIGNKEKIFWKESYAIGAARLIDKFRYTEPILEKDLKIIKEYFDIQLVSLINAAKKFDIKKLIGSAGSFESIADLINSRLNGNLQLEENGYCEIDVPDFKKIHSMLLGSTLEQRLNMPGLVGYRAEMMVVSSIMIDFVLSKLKIKELICSSFSLKEGILFR